MTPAAVGFQCPSCVAEGRRSTRSGRTAYGGQRSANPQATSVALIVTNAMVWLAVAATGGRQSWLVDRLALLPRGRCTEAAGYYPGVTSEGMCQTRPAATWYDGVADGAWWQLVTNGFAHVEIWHIGLNMLALWILGPQLEAMLGRWRFLALYVGSLLSASTLVYWLSDERSATLGASGAIFGLFAGLLVVAHKVRGNVQPLLILLGINVVITVGGASFISWQGHLGGFVGGLLMILLFVYAPRGRRTTWHLLGLGVLAAVLLVGLVARTLALA